MKRLNEVADLIREAGAVVEIASIDATDAEKMKQYIQEKDKEYKVGCALLLSPWLDLVIAGVGLVAPANACEMSLGEVVLISAGFLLVVRLHHQRQHSYVQKCSASHY